MAILHPYFDILLLIILVLVFLEIEEIINDKNNIIPIILGIVLIFLAGFRYYSGPDYTAYLAIFKESVTYFTSYNDIINSETTIEKGYLLLNRFIGLQGLQFYWVTFIIAFFAITLKLKSFNDFSPYPILSIALFYSPIYFFEDLGQIRQGLVVGICSYSVRFIINRNIVYFILCILIGSAIHSVALVFSLAYWIAPLNLKTNHWWVLIIGSMVLSPLKVYEVFTPILEQLGLGASDRFKEYATDTEFGTAIKFGIGDITRIVLILIILIFDKYALNKFYYYKYYRNLTLFNSFLYYIFRSNNIFAARLAGVYAAYSMFAIPYILASLKNNSSKVYIKIYIFVFLVLIYFRFSELNGFNYIIYRNVIFENIIDFENIPDYLKPE